VISGSPTTWTDCSPETVFNAPLLFKCPSAAEDTPIIENRNIDTTTISYIYSNSTGSPNTPYLWSDVTIEADTPLFADRKGNHKRTGNVVLGDAHVEQAAAADWWSQAVMTPPNALQEMVEFDENYDPEDE
jgi:hypothetical protein